MKIVEQNLYIVKVTNRTLKFGFKVNKISKKF